MPTFRLTLAACALALAAPALTAKPVDQVRVGFSTSISGPFAALGAEARDGFNLGIKQLGGKLGGHSGRGVRDRRGRQPGHRAAARRPLHQARPRPLLHRPDRIQRGAGRRPGAVRRAGVLPQQQRRPVAARGQPVQPLLLRHGLAERRVPRGRRQVRRRARLQAGRGARPQLPGRTGRDQRLQARLRQAGRSPRPSPSSASSTTPPNSRRSAPTRPTRSSSSCPAAWASTSSSSSSARGCRSRRRSSGRASRRTRT